MSQFMKPEVKFVGSTQYTITLKWTIGNNQIDDDETVSYRVQIADPTYEWITKYWGIETKATITQLSPEEVYVARVSVDSESLAEELWSDPITVATQFPFTGGPLWTFYMFRSIERSDSKQLQEYLSTRSKAMETVNRYGKTPLMEAARLGEVGCVTVLLNAGSKPHNRMYPSLQTPLMAASFGGHKEVALILVGYGACWLDRDRCGRDALHYAICNSMLELVRMALDGGCPINAKDNYDWTPLMRAVIMGSSDDVVSELLEYGADPEIRDELGHNCLEIARLYKNESIIDLLSNNENCQASSLIEDEQKQPNSPTKDGPPLV